MIQACGTGGEPWSH